MSNREEILGIVERYVEGINSNNIDIIPMTTDIEFRGPMLPEPLIGEEAARKHLGDAAPFFSMELLYVIIENDTAAAMMEIEAVNGVRINGAAFLRFRDGAICFDQAFYDTHRLFKGRS